MESKRITVFAGHYGSGKTNIALNYAFWLKQRHKEVVLCDLDIVNPYFRTADFKDVLQEAGIRLITSPYANTNVELVSLPAETQRIFDEENVHAVVDLGGDERGALALGRYAKSLREEDSEMLLVVNPFRPLTANQKDLHEVVREIEGAARIPFSALVNNANLGEETSLADVLEGLPFAKEAADSLHLPLRTSVVTHDVLGADAVLAGELQAQSEVFPIRLFHKPNWIL